MLKTTAAVTILSAPTTQVDASPLAKAVAAPMQDYAQRAWPYQRCAGTEFGNPHIRLVNTDRLD